MTDSQVLKLVDEFTEGRRTLSQFCKSKNISLPTFRKRAKKLLGESWGKLLAKKKPKSTQYALGRAFEYRVRKYFEKHGFPVVVRSAQSKGNFDLVAVKDGNAYLIQCKRSGGIDKSECNESFDKAMLAGGIFILAENPTGSALDLWVVRGHVGTDGWRAKWDHASMGG